jgi:hypothetical protein
MPVATTTTEQLTAVRIKGLDYDVEALRVYLRDTQDSTSLVASQGAAKEGDDVEMTFVAPRAGTYDLIIKADLAGGDTRTVLQAGNAVRVRADYSA